MLSERHTGRQCLRHYANHTTQYMVSLCKCTHMYTKEWSTLDGRPTLPLPLLLGSVHAHTRPCTPSAVLILVPRAARAVAAMMQTHLCRYGAAAEGSAALRVC